MLKIAVLVWIMLGTALAGSLVLLVVAIPSLAEQAVRLIPWSAALGFATAVPLAVMVARRIASAVRA